MGAFLGAWLGEHYRQKHRAEEAEDYKNKSVIDAYLRNDPNNPVAEEAAQYAYKALGKKLPKEIQGAVADKIFPHPATQAQNQPQQPNTVASQGPPPLSTDKSPVPMGGPSAPSIPPPPTDQSVANPFSSAAAPAAPVAAAAPVAPPYVPGSLPHMKTPLELFNERQLPLQRAVAQVGPEMARAAVGRYEAAAGSGAFAKLPREQQFDVILGKEMRFAPVHTAGEGQILYDATGKQIGVGPDKPVTTAPGAVTTVVPSTINGAAVGAPGIPPPPGSESSIGGRVIASPPPLLDPTDRAAKASYIAQQQQKNPQYQWTDADLPAARSLFTMATHVKTPEQENHDAAVRTIAEKANIKLDESKPLLPQLPAGLQAKAVTFIKQLETAPSLEANRQMIMALRQMQLRDMQGAHDTDVDELYFNQVKTGALRLDQVPVKNGAQTRVAKMFAESGQNPPVALSPSFQTALSTVEPVLAQVQRLKADLEPLKANNTPGYFLPDRVKYAVGMGGSTAGEIADLSLSSIVGAARVLKGSSRAHQIFEKALDHTPNAWKDSPQLIYDKLSTIERNLMDGKAALIQDGSRSGVVGGTGATPPPTIPKPPGSRPPLSSFERK